MLGTLFSAAVFVVAVCIVAFLIQYVSRYYYTDPDRFFSLCALIIFVSTLAVYVALAIAGEKVIRLAKKH